MNVKNYICVLSLIVFGFVACKDSPLPRIFLIPSDYQGILRIVYNEKCGVQPQEMDGSEVFEFQKNGLLVVSIDNDPRIKKDFYLVDDNGRKTKVNYISDAEDRFHKMPAILTGGVVVSNHVVNIVNSKTTTVSGGAECMDFYLYNKDTTKIEDSKLSQKLDLMTNSIVNACRENK